MIISKKNNVKNPEWSLVRFIVVFFIIEALNLLVKNIFSEWLVWDVLSKVILAVFLLMALRSMISRGGIILFFSEAIMIVMLLVSLLLGNANSSYFYSIAFKVLLAYIPLGVCAYCVDAKYLLKMLYIAAWPIQIILLIVLLQFTGQSSTEYSMSAGYAMVFVEIIVCDHLLQRINIIDLIAIVVDLTAILICGSRGPFLCVIGYCFLRILFSNQISIKKKICAVISVLMIGLFAYKYYYDIALAISRLANLFGYSSRNLRMLLSNNIASDSGRSKLTTYYWSLIDEKPIVGWGLAGGWLSSGSYPHNIIIEIILSFGYIGGSVILIVLAFFLLNGVFCRSVSLQRLSHILISVSIGLLVSGTFLQSAKFFFCLFVCIKCVKIRKQTWKTSQTKTILNVGEE